MYIRSSEKIEPFDATKSGNAVTRIYTNDLYAPLKLSEIEQMAKVQGRPLFWAMFLVGVLLFASALCASNVGRLERFEKLYGERKASETSSDSAIENLLQEIKLFEVENKTKVVDLVPAKKLGNRPTVLWLKDRVHGADLYCDDMLVDNLDDYDWQQTIRTHRQGEKLELIIYRLKKNGELRANDVSLAGTKEINELKIVQGLGHYTIYWLIEGKKHKAKVVTLSASSQSAHQGSLSLHKLQLALDDFQSEGNRRIVGMAGHRQLMWLRDGNNCELFAGAKLVDFVKKDKWSQIICNRTSGKELRLVVYRHDARASLRANGYIIPSSRKVQIVKPALKGRRYRISFHDDQGRNCWVDVPTLDAVADVPSGALKTLKLNFQKTPATEDDETAPTDSEPVQNPYGVHANLTASEVERIVDQNYLKSAKAIDGLRRNEWGVAVGRSKTAIITHAGTIDGFKNRYECLIAHNADVQKALAKAAAKKKKAASQAE